MESRYGIGINNRYALFLDSDDEGSNVEDLVKNAAPTSTDTKKASDSKVNGAVTAAKKDAVKPKDKTNNREDKENRNNRGDGKRPPLDARKSGDNREDRNNRRNRDGAGGQAAERDGENRGGGRGGRRGGPGGAGRGGRGGPRGGGQGGRREFDRKSGDDKTGVKAVDKRDGGGAYNWGSMSDELKAEQDTANTSTDAAAVSGENAAAASGDKDGDAAPSGGEQPAGGDQEPKEEEVKTLTLAEWKAQQAEKKEHKFNLRKAGEGSDNVDPKWKKAYAYKKEKETAEEDEDEDGEYYISKNQRKKVLDIDFTFNDANRGAPGGRGGGRGRGRGGPGGDRGGRRDGRDREGGGGDREGGPRRGGEGGPRRGGPRGGGRGGARGSDDPKNAPNVFDAENFPSLG